MICKTQIKAWDWEDLVQDTAMRGLRYSSTYKETGQFRTWLAHIAKTIWLDQLRHKGFVREYERNYTGMGFSSLPANQEMHVELCDTIKAIDSWIRSSLSHSIMKPLV